MPGNTSCEECPHGWSNSGSGSTGCNAVPPGSYAVNGLTKICRRGFTCADKNTPIEPCATGRYTNNTGSVSCIPCSPGTFANDTGSTQCKDCPTGYLQPEPEQAKCEKVPAGEIVAKGGSASVVVPQGSKINASEPSGFVACLAGTKGSIPPNETCTKCLAGESSAAGATTCQPCDKGKFSSAPGSICQDCPAGTFQEQNTLPSSECQTCPAGWEQPLEGSPSCTSLNWKTIEICNKENDMYLNNTSSSPSNWTCEPCPPGGDCSYAVAWKDLKPKFGWWKIPRKERDNQRQAFAECLFAPACLGGVNKLLVARHPEAAAEHRNRTCNTELGFRNTSRLCHTCATGYKRKGTNRCDECPPSAGENVGLVILGVVLILLVLVYLVGDAINDSGKQSLSGSIQKIILNYLQVVTLFNGFPLR